MAHLAFTSLEKLVELLRAAPVGEGAYVSVLGRDRLAVGTDPLHPVYAIDLAKEALIRRAGDETPMNLAPSSAPRTDAENQSASNGHRKAQKASHPGRSGTSLMRRLAANQ